MLRIISTTTILIILTSCAIEDLGYPKYGRLFELFYTQPGTDRISGIDKEIDLRLSQMIDNAQETIDAAFFNFSRKSIIDSLIQAHQRGIIVRFVGDIDENESYGYQAIESAGIEKSVGNANAIMHNKFVIIDQRFVFGGSGNISDNGFLRNDNNFFLIESTQMVTHYQDEFNQLFHGYFAKKKKSRTKRSKYFINGIKVEDFFSPGEGSLAIKRLIELVNNAQYSINFMIYAFTDDELAAALVEASKRGVFVSGVIDGTFMRGVSQEAPRLYSAATVPTGPWIYRDGNEHTVTLNDPSHGGKMHCKTMLIDTGTPQAKTITGSFNWSSNAISNNDENMVVFHSQRVTDYLMQQWQQAFNISVHPIISKLTVTGDSIGAALGFDESEECHQRILKEKDVLINEIHWAGSADSSRNGDDLMVELKNMTPCVIHLSHWNLEWIDDAQQRRLWPIPDNNNAYNDNENYLLPANGFLIIQNQSYKAFEETICRDDMLTNDYCRQRLSAKISLDECQSGELGYYCASGISPNALIPPELCQFNPQISSCQVFLYDYCAYNHDHIDSSNCLVPLSDIKITGSKDFKLIEQSFQLILRDKKMQIVDVAGDAGLAPAGGVQNITGIPGQELFVSMERRDPGENNLEYYTGGQIKTLASDKAMQSWDGGRRENWCSSLGDGSALRGNNYVNPNYRSRVIATPRENGHCKISSDANASQ